LREIVRVACHFCLAADPTSERDGR
jgi:hypothetical protein